MLTNDEYKARLEEVQSVTVTLDDDPINQGLQSINKKIATVQRAKDRIGHLLVESIKNRAECQIILDGKKAEYNIELDHLLATDMDVQAQKSEALRKATANTKMADVVLQMHYAEKDFTTADAYHKCVNQIYANLESVNSNLSRQVSVIQMGISIGEVNGDTFKELFQGRSINVK